MTRILSLILISSPPTSDVVAGCNKQRSAICSRGSPACLRWITDVVKLARNANRIGAIFSKYGIVGEIELLRHTLRPQRMFT